jgi:hypothetical protein
MEAVAATIQRLKITEAGQPCRHCQTPVVVKQHKPGFKFKPEKRAYWYEWWLACPKCHALYMTEDAKRFPDSPAPTKVSWMDKPVSLNVDGGEAAILLGLITTEWASIARDENRASYYRTLTILREKLIKAQP